MKFLTIWMEGFEFSMKSSILWRSDFNCSYILPWWSEQMTWDELISVTLTYFNIIVDSVVWSFIRVGESCFVLGIETFDFGLCNGSCSLIEKFSLFIEERREDEKERDLPTRVCYPF